MKIQLSIDNPFASNRYGFLWEVLRTRRPGVHLDYGCFDGKILAQLSATGVLKEGVGVDVNGKAVEVGKRQMPSNVRLQIIAKNTTLPFSDELFDSVSVLDVIEHIVDQQAVLKELRRVLSPSGVMVITVPKRHVLSFLDAGNWKFVFPRSHRLFYTIKHGKAAYARRYIDCENGLFGDIEKGKGWHQHFSERELSLLLGDAGLVVSQFDGTGFFYRPLSLLKYCLPSFMRPIMEKLMLWDARQFQSSNLFCVATR